MQIGNGGCGVFGFPEDALFHAFEVSCDGILDVFIFGECGVRGDGLLKLAEMGVNVGDALEVFGIGGECRTGKFFQDILQCLVHCDCLSVVSVLGCVDESSAVPWTQLKFGSWRELLQFTPKEGKTT